MCVCVYASACVYIYIYICIHTYICLSIPRHHYLRLLIIIIHGVALAWPSLGCLGASRVITIIMIFIITILVVILIIIFTIIINNIIVSPDVVTVVLLIIVLHIINIINCVYTKIVIVVVGQMVSERPPGASAAVWKAASGLQACRKPFREHLADVRILRELGFFRSLSEAFSGPLGETGTTQPDA